MSGFGPEHLPYGVFRTRGAAARVGVRLGDGVLDLAALAADGTLDEDPALFAQPSLNAFMAAGPVAWS
ncbi:MAG: fumarylacetoacetase, partial [Actinomycetota bacterium]|nr:fumarylacetoacetase [Actinomycetota bacterium]